MKAALIALWTGASLLLQDPLPELDGPPAAPALAAPAEPTPQPAPTPVPPAETPVAPAPQPQVAPAQETPPAPVKKKKRKKKRAPTVTQETPAAAPAVEEPAKAPRIRRALVPRPSPLDFTTQWAPLSWKDRGLLALAQTGCAAMGVGGTLAAAGGGALLARALDRPAGGLAVLPFQAGGIIPIAAALSVSGLSTALCVAGLGAMGERRVFAPAAAMATWALVATGGAAIGLGVTFLPLNGTARNMSIKEDVVAVSIIAFGVLAPVAALAAYHAAGFLQQSQDEARFQDELLAARAALEEDARKKAAQPPPPPVVPVEAVPAPQPTPPPEPETPPPERIPADPLDTVSPPAVLDAPIPAVPVP